MPRFAISRLSALGDVVCSLPVAGALKRGFPDCEVVWLVDSRFSGIVACCSAVDRIVETKSGSAPTLEGEFDAALDLQGLFKSAWVLRSAKAKTRLTYHWAREGSGLLGQRVLPDPTSNHIVDQYVDVARAAGGQADRAEFNLVPPDDALERISAKVSGRFVALNAGAAWVTKRWPPGHFAALSDRLAERDVKPVFVGHGSSDESTFAEIKSLCRQEPGSLIGQTPLTDLIALISRAAAHVGGDTGTTHIAGALGVQAIGLYSLTRPERSCPYGQIENCLADRRGLDRIAVDAVWEKLSSTLCLS